MSIRGFVLGVVLIAVVGWCMVEETVAQTRARYRLAEMAQREDEVRKRLAKLQTQEEALRSPVRLARLVREHKMQLVSLGSARPDSGAKAAERRPGEVLDNSYIEAERELASLGQW